MNRLDTIVALRKLANDLEAVEFPQVYNALRVEVAFHQVHDLETLKAAAAVMRKTGEIKPWSSQNNYYWLTSESSKLAFNVKTVAYYDKGLLGECKEVTETVTKEDTDLCLLD
jgi:Fe2+ or Zn2+ uptake regulation protein